MMPVSAWRRSLSLPPSTPLGYRDRMSPGRWMKDAHARQTAQQGPGQARKVRSLVCWPGSLQRPAGGSWELANTPGTWQRPQCGRYLGCVLCSDSSCPLGSWVLCCLWGCTQEACGEGPDAPNQRSPPREERKCLLGVRRRGGHWEYEVL